jgi:endonuclease I
MKRYIVLLFPFFAMAQMPAYYNSIDFDLTGDALKAQLATLITNTHTNNLQYTPEVWDALKEADLDPANPENVFLIYGYNDSDAHDDNDRTRDKDLSCHNTSCAGKWVREHVYPRSLGNPNLEYSGPGADAHHLRAIDHDMNNDRSNKRFSDSSGDSAIMGATFYPGDEWKGDIARMMMYMYVRYGDRCEATNVAIGSTSYSNFGDMPNIFLEWNTEDPVSQYEKNRNTILQTMQGNRNPFIDNPYIATIIWNGPAAQDIWGTLAVADVQFAGVYVYPTVTTGTVHIENAGVDYTYKVYNSHGQEVTPVVSGNTIDLHNNASGMYILSVQEGAAQKTFKIMLH